MSYFPFLFWTFPHFFIYQVSPLPSTLFFQDYFLCSPLLPWHWQPRAWQRPLLLGDRRPRFRDAAGDHLATGYTAGSLQWLDLICCQATLDPHTDGDLNTDRVPLTDVPVWMCLLRLSLDMHNIILPDNVQCPLSSGSFWLVNGYLNIVHCYPTLITYLTKGSHVTLKCCTTCSVK